MLHYRKQGPLHALCAGIIVLCALTESSYAQLKTDPNTLYLIAGGNRANGRFNQPAGVVQQGTGAEPYLLVADSQNHVIRKINKEGFVLPFAGVLGKCGYANEGVFKEGRGDRIPFCNPVGIAADAQGNLYMADRESHLVRMSTPSGLVTILAGNGKPGHADAIGDRAQFRNPSGIAVDSARNVYVADTGNHVIRKIAPDGQVSTVAGRVGVCASKIGYASNSASLCSPTGLAIDKAGSLYIADTGNNQIRKIELRGPDGSEKKEVAIENVAGAPYSLEGPGLNIKENTCNLSWVTQDRNGYFCTPVGIAIDDRTQSIYVADFGNSAIRKITVTNIGPPEVGTVIGGWKLDGNLREKITPKTQLGVLPKQIAAPLGLAILGSGRLVITTADNEILGLNF